MSGQLTKSRADGSACLPFAAFTMMKAVSSHLGLSGHTSLRSVATAAASSFYDITESVASGETLSFAKFKGKVVSS